MNLLKHYIIEIIFEKEVEVNDTKYMTVIVKCDCYGNVQEYEHTTTKEDWEKEKAIGYFMG